SNSSGSTKSTGGAATMPTAATPNLSVNTGPAPWPRPDDAIQRVAAAGLPAFTEEQLFVHVHAHMDIFIDGQPTVIPAGIGIGGDPHAVVTVENGQQVAGLSGKCTNPCIS